MLLNQYGGCKGVQEITGLVNLLNPIGIIAVALFLTGVWIYRLTYCITFYIIYFRTNVI